MDEDGGHIQVQEDKLRILYIIDTYVGVNAGGSERHLYNVISRLDPACFDATVVQLTQITDIPYPVGHLDGKAHIKVMHWPVGRIYGVDGLSTIKKVQDLVREESIDIVQSAHEKSDLINAVLTVSRGKPIKISSRRDMGFKKNARLKMLFRILNSRFSTVIAPSRAILDDLIENENVKPDNTSLIFNGVDLDQFPNSSKRLKEKARRRLALPEDSVVLGSVASLQPVKGHRFLLQAFEQVMHDIPGVKLLLVGDGGLRNELEKQVHSTSCADSVVFLGQRDDVDSIIHAFDAVVSSSLSEGSSNALLEAAASGIPIIATRVGGNHEIVQDGINGYLVAPSDVNGLYRGIVRLLADPNTQLDMGRESRRLAELQFSMDAMMAGYQRLYHNAS